MNSKILIAFMLVFSGLALFAAGEFKTDIFPFKFMKGESFTVAENLPAMLQVNVWASDARAKKEFGREKPVLTVELPDFMTLAGACILPGRAVKLENLPFQTQKITRDGAAYNRYTIPFFYRGNWNNMLTVKYPHSYNDFRIYLDAVPGSAGKKGMMYWRVTFGKGTSEESMYPVAAVSSVKKNTKAAKYFEVLPGKTVTAETPFADMNRKHVDFWKGLSDKAAVYREYFSPKDPHTAQTLFCDIMLGTAKQFFYVGGPEYFDAGIRGWEKLLKSGKVPRQLDEKGKPLGDPRATPVWYLVDDPEGLYARYLADGIRLMRQNYPNLRRVYLNYEPGVAGFDEQALKRFAKVAGLKEVPSRANVASGKYKQKWFQYAMDLNHQHLEKVTKIIRKEYPGIQVWLCTDNLHTGSAQVAYWCALDSVRADAVVDGHQPMPYYTGTAFFDDMALTVSKLKKPVVPINDPSERSLRFFVKYTPDKLYQNIIACAAVGAKGFGLWPDSLISGIYSHRIQSAYEKIAAVEEFYFKGGRSDSKVSVEVANTHTAELPGPGGKTIKVSYPDYTPHIRKTVHELKGELLVTLFNYHETLPLFINLKASGISGRSVVSEVGGVRYDGADIAKGELVKIEPNGVKIIKIGRSAVSAKKADRKALKAELDKSIANLSKSTTLRNIEKDGVSASWRIPGGSKVPALMLKNRDGQQVLVSAFGTHEIIFWHNTVAQGTLGGFALYDQDRVKAPYPFVIKDIAVNDGKASAAFEYVFSANDADGSFEQENLKVVQTYSIGKKNEFTMSWRLTNGGQAAMRAGFRVKNMPFRNARQVTAGSVTLKPTAASANRILLKEGESVRFLSTIAREKWDGGAVTAISPSRKVTFLAPDFAGVYSFTSPGTVTVEFLTGDFTLKPGESRTFSITVQF